jgi:hydroxyacylglutathione hydrolase
VDEVAPGVFVATAELYVTTTTVVAGADGGCLVIDPAVTVAELDELASWLSAAGLRPVAGWSTHPHWDHVLWSGPLGYDVVRYATRRAVEVAARELPGLVSGMEEAAPGHDLTLFARLAPLDEPEIPWRGPRATVLAHDAHAPGHGAVFLPDTGVRSAGTGTGSACWPMSPACGWSCPGTVTPATPRSSGGGSSRTSAT